MRSGCKMSTSEGGRSPSSDLGQEAALHEREKGKREGLASPTRAEEGNEAGNPLSVGTG